MGSVVQVTDRLIIPIMKLLIFIACVALAIAAPKGLRLGQDIVWEWCGEGRPIDITQLTVEPYPVVVADGATITAAITIEILEVVPVGTQISVKIVKEGLINMPLPCLEIDGHHLGSCDYDGDYLLTVAKDALCGDKYTPGGYFPAGQECKLPLQPGTYGGKDPIVLTLPALPDIILPFTHGKFHADLKALHEDGSEIGCAIFPQKLGKKTKWSGRVSQ